MAIDFQHIYLQIKEIGRGAQERRLHRERAQAVARRLLEQYADEGDFLRAKVDAAKATDPHLRCAYPLNEPLASAYPPPASAPSALLLAADGSHIAPDRHAAVPFCLINAAAILLRSGSGAAPEVYTHSQLLYGEELETQTGAMTEGLAALRRDLKERALLEELSRDVQGPVVTFTDGPIELWGSREGEDARAYQEALQSYLAILSRLQTRGVIVAGYVDKPSANLVVRLLEVASSTGQDRPPSNLRGVSDRWLYGEKCAPLLLPGHRSAVFGLHSRAEKEYQGALALCFFYLNVGAEGHPWPVRVEIPRWVADDPAKLDLLHAVLIEQCRLMGSRPYPYLLHRAHETARVGLEEKYQVEQMLLQELRRQEEEVDEGSYKQSAKNLAGRTRK